MTGIYKITNLINGKSYVGQSVNIKKRWKNHISDSKKSSRDHYPLYRAFHKYGIENFSFEVLEECPVLELNDREIYYIKKYDTYFNGYNQGFGGDQCQTFSNKPQIVGIIKDLEETELYHKTIAEKWNISQEMVQGINTGRYYKQDRNYPIQTIRQPKPKKKNYCIDCNAEIDKESTRCIKCYRASQKQIERPSPLKLAQLVSEKGFVQTGEQFGVSDNAIKKWCKAYNIPHLKKELIEWYNKQIGKEAPKKEKIYAVRKVRQIDPFSNKTINIFGSITLAAQSLNKSNGSHISAVCRGKRKTAYGYKWKYIED